MAGLLERLESQPLGASAAQFRDVARLLNTLLSEAAPGAELDALLVASPTLAELYENQHYAQAGPVPLAAGSGAQRRTRRHRRTDPRRPQEGLRRFERQVR